MNLIFGLLSYFNFDGTTLKKELIHSKLFSVPRDSEGTGRLTAFSFISCVCVCEDFSAESHPEPFKGVTGSFLSRHDERLNGRPQASVAHWAAAR